MKIGLIISVLFFSSCTVSYEPETQACMVSFSPSGEQIRAIGECAAALYRIEGVPTPLPTLNYTEIGEFSESP